MEKSSRPRKIVESRQKFSPDMFDFDLGRFKGEHYGRVIDMLMGTEKWNAMLEKRHKLCLAFDKPGGNPAIIARGITEMDKKMAYELYSYLAIQCIKDDEAPADDAPQNVIEFFSKFNNDPEKKEDVDKFWALMRRIYIISDICTGYIKDADGILRSLDEKQMYVNMFSLEEAMSNMRKVSEGCSKLKTEEENDLFHDYCDSIENYINMRSKAFDKKIDAIYDRNKRANEKERIAKRKASGRTIKK